MYTKKKLHFLEWFKDKIDTNRNSRAGYILNDIALIGCNQIELEQELNGINQALAEKI